MTEKQNKTKQIKIKQNRTRQNRKPKQQSKTKVSDIKPRKYITKRMLVHMYYTN